MGATWHTTARFYIQYSFIDTDDLVALSRYKTIELTLELVLHLINATIDVSVKSIGT